MTYKIIWTPEAQKDLAYWKTKNIQVLGRISELISSIETSPKLGIGKPEPLKYKNQNIWSRRIDREHRIVYLIDAEEVYIIQCRFHY